MKYSIYNVKTHLRFHIAVLLLVFSNLCSGQGTNHALGATVTTFNHNSAVYQGQPSSLTDGNITTTFSFTNPNDDLIIQLDEFVENATINFLNQGGASTIKLAFKNSISGRYTPFEKMSTIGIKIGGTWSVNHDFVFDQIILRADSYTYLRHVNEVEVYGDLGGDPYEDFIYYPNYDTTQNLLSTATLITTITDPNHANLDYIADGNINTLETLNLVNFDSNGGLNNFEYLLNNTYDNLEFIVYPSTNPTNAGSFNSGVDYIKLINSATNAEISLAMSNSISVINAPNARKLVAPQNFVADRILIYTVPGTGSAYFREMVVTGNTVETTPPPPPVVVTPTCEGAVNGQVSLVHSTNSGTMHSSSNISVTTHTPPNCENRLLVAVIGYEGVELINTVTYGGQPMTRASGLNDPTFSNDVYIYYLKEAGINAATSNQFNVTFSNGGIASGGYVLQAHTLAGVDQDNPIFSSGSNKAENTNVISFTNSLNYINNGLVLTALTGNTIVSQNYPPSGYINLAAQTGVTTTNPNGFPGSWTLISNYRANLATGSANPQHTINGLISRIALTGVVFKAAPVSTPPPTNNTTCSTQLILNPNPQSNLYINSGCWTTPIVNTNTTDNHNTPQLDSPQGWTAPNNSQGNYIGMLFDSPRGIIGITTKGRNSVTGYSQWVISYRLEGTKNGTTWQSLGVFPGNTDSDTAVYNAVGNTDTDWTGMRIVPLTFHAFQSLRFQFTLCEPAANPNEGNSNSTICTFELALNPNPQSNLYINSGCWTTPIVNTNTTNNHNTPQLDSPQGWTAPNNSQGNYIGMLFDSPRGIIGITTKGRNSVTGYSQWVISYRLEGTKNGTTWQSLGVFPGNTDSDTAVYNTVANTDTDWTGMRIVPLTFHAFQSLRFQFTLCYPQATSNCVASDVMNNYSRSATVTSTGNTTTQDLNYLNDGLLGSSSATTIPVGGEVKLALTSMIANPEIVLRQIPGAFNQNVKVLVPNTSGGYDQINQTGFNLSPDGNKQKFKVVGRTINHFKILNDADQTSTIAEIETLFDNDVTNPVVGGAGGNEFWKKSVIANTIFHEDGLVRIGNSTTLPTFNSTTNTYNATTGLLVNGHSTFNVGRGDVFFENNMLDDATGAGLTLRTSNNPSINAPIFSVRSAAGAARLWVGSNFSSFGSNDFYFGGAAAELAEQDTSKFKGILKNDGRVGIGFNTPERALHIRGEADGGVRIDRNQMGAKILFANYTPNWATVNSSGTVGFEADGTFMITDLNSELSGSNPNPLLRIDATTHDVKIPHTLSVGKDAVKIAGAVAHFDGRVYISEEDSKVDTSAGESTTEKGFSSIVSQNYKDYLLWVEKGMVSNDLALVELDDTDWPDYVFKADYELNSIEYLKTYIQEKGHLPTMPSAEEVEKNGFTVTDMTKRTLKTVEELLLHIIAQEEKIAQLKATLEEYNKLSQQLEEQINTNKK